MQTGRTAVSTDGAGTGERRRGDGVQAPARLKPCATSAQRARPGGAPPRPPRPSIRHGPVCWYTPDRFAPGLTFFFPASTQSRQTVFGAGYSLRTLSCLPKLTALHGSKPASQPPSLDHSSPPLIGSLYLALSHHPPPQTRPSDYYLSLWDPLPLPS